MKQITGLPSHVVLILLLFFFRCFANIGCNAFVLHVHFDPLLRKADGSIDTRRVHRGRVLKRRVMGVGLGVGAKGP